MRLKTSHPSFKLLPAVGAVALLSALAACGGGPIDNSGVVGTASKNPAQGGNNTLATNGIANGNTTTQALERCMATGEGCGNLTLNYEQWKQAAANSEEGRKLAQQKLTEEQKREQEVAKQKQIAETRKLAYELLKNDDDGKLKYIIVGLDKDPFVDQKTSQTASYVSLQGQDLYQYYKQNCPVTVGNDPLALYRCMAGVYVGSNSKDKPCYTLIQRDGVIRHINDTNVVLDFKTVNIKNGIEKPTIPEFTRLDAGGDMFMLINATKTYDNPLNIQQKLDVLQTFRIQQMVFQFNSLADDIKIFQRNTDESWTAGTGGFEDICTVNFRYGIGGKPAEVAPANQTGSSSGSASGG